MLDFDGAVIKRLINKGECTGAMLSTSTNEYLILDVATLLKLREHLENFGQRLDNAYITRIGTIVPYDNLKKVEDVEVLEVTETFQELNDLSSPATNAE
ncbi:MAG: hypothetical protein LBC41_07990 [Clostridiales bacterium]|jgi:hypothetical protein|nr:hypothetical protein [Clostridiales bacterium]